MFAIYFKGVWTLEEKGEKPTFNVTFESAEPTYTHRALVAMEIIGKISFIALCTHYSKVYITGHVHIYHRSFIHVSNVHVKKHKHV